MYARNQSVTPIPFTIRPKKTATLSIRDGARAIHLLGHPPPISWWKFASLHTRTDCVEMHRVCGMNVRKFVSCYQQRLLSVHYYQKVLAVPRWRFTWTLVIFDSRVPARSQEMRGAFNTHRWQLLNEPNYGTVQPLQWNEVVDVIIAGWNLHLAAQDEWGLESWSSVYELCSRVLSQDLMSGHSVKMMIFKKLVSHYWQRNAVLFAMSILIWEFYTIIIFIKFYIKQNLMNTHFEFIFTIYKNLGNLFQNGVIYDYRFFRDR